MTDTKVEIINSNQDDSSSPSSSILLEPFAAPDDHHDEADYCPSHALPQTISLEFITSRCLTIVVGSESNVTEFSCHEKLLKTYSQYFRNLINNNNARGMQTVTYELPGDDPASFAVIVQWLYSKTVILPAATASGNRMNLIRAWCLAEKLGVPDCQNALMDKIHASLTDGRKEKSAIGVKVMKLVNDLALPENNILRVFFVQRFAYEMSEMKQYHCRSNGGLKNGYVQFFKTCHSLIPDVMIEWYSLSLRDDRTDPANHTNVCAYHVHGEPVAEEVAAATEQSVDERVACLFEEPTANETEKHPEVGPVQANDEKELRTDETEAVPGVKVLILEQPKSTPLAESSAFQEWVRLRQYSTRYGSGSSASADSQISSDEEDLMSDKKETATDGKALCPPLRVLMSKAV